MKNKIENVMVIFEDTVFEIEGKRFEGVMCSFEYNDAVLHFKSQKGDTGLLSYMRKKMPVVEEGKE